MSLLDDVSIVVTPNGYKAGELYAVIPSNGDADMDVTRATAATRVDENGLVNYAEIIGGEEVTNGDFSNGLTDWTENGGSYATIVSGALNSNNPDAGNWYAENISQNVSFVNGTTYKLTFKAKNISGNLNLRITQGANAMASLDLTSTFVDYTYFYTANADNGSVRIFCNSAVGQFEIDNISVKEVTRDNVPRIDYTGGGCPHILAEPQRTNLIPYSEDFSQWTSVGSPTLTPDYGLSPDGTENSTRIELSANARIYTGLSASGDIAFSVYLKGSGVITLRDNTNVYRQDVTLTSEWARYDLYFNATITNVQIQNQTASAVDCELWGAQVEEGSYATSYIPTSGSTVTRNQDIFTRDGIGSLINSTEGVLFLEVAALVDEAVNRQISISDNSTNNVIAFSYSGATNNINATIKIGGVVNRSFDYVLSDVTQESKIAIRYSNTEFSFWVDGTETSVNTLASSFSEGTLNRLAFDSGAGFQKFFGKVKQLQVYDTALTDTQLTSLTS